MIRRVADILIDALLAAGITNYFGVVGGGAMHLDNALALNKDIQKCFNHNEQASAMAAEAYARVSGRCAAVIVTSGPGATNAITGVMGAWQDSIPMVVLSGQVRYEISTPASGLPLRYRGPQEFDIIPSVTNMTKYAVQIREPKRALYELQKAIFLAMDGRRGPVWLDVPLNVQNHQVEESDLPWFNPSDGLSRCRVDETAVDRVFATLSTASRPCILAGSGIISADKEEIFESFVNMMEVPVIGGALVGECFYREHPFYFGLSGNIGPRIGNFILQNADVILVIGNSLGFRQTGYDQQGFAPNAHIIMVDIDESEPQKPGLKIDDFVQADIGVFLSACLERKERIDVPSEWWGYCHDLESRFDIFEGAQGSESPDEKVSSYYFWKLYDDLAPKDDIVCLGCNSACSAKVQVGKRFREQRIITNYTCGSLGSDLPYSIGSAFASGKRITCVTGDGGIMFNLQELQTIKHHALPINVIMFSNGGYNAFRQTCKNFFDGVYIGCTPESGISFPKAIDLANTFGFEYIRCATNGDLEASFRYLYTSTRPVFLEVEQRYDDPVTPKLMPRLLADGTFESPVLHDMFPFLEKDELERLML